MSLEKWFVDADVLDGDDTLLGRVDHPVDQQERITVRQNGLNFGNIQASFSPPA